ncbi:MAG: hypothetical protein GY754_13545 [bacterium]|nr:hypothetical protein [bacterium]
MEALYFALSLLTMLFIMRYWHLFFRIFDRRHGERRIYDNRFAGIGVLDKRMIERREH